MKKIRILLVMASFLLVVNCKKRSDVINSVEDIAESISYVSDFPKNYTLEEKTKLGIDVLGILDFEIKDSLLIVSKRSDDKFWVFYRLPNYDKLGAFLNKGRGPFELSSPPFFANSTSFLKEQGERYSYILNRGNLFKFNIDKSIATGQLEMSVVRDSLSDAIFACQMIDNNDIFIRKINDSRTKQNRYVLKNGVKTTTSFLDKLNQIAIKKGLEPNILTSVIRYHSKKKLFVETPIMCNYIMVYNLDGAFFKVICLEDELNTIKMVQKKSEEEWSDQFKGVCSFDDFFGVVYTQGAKYYYDEEDEELDSKNLYSSILLFDWQGNPLAKLKLKNQITSFGIDFKNGELYTLNFDEEDSFYKYDIKHIIKELE